jgi:hypothetical protein
MASHATTWTVLPHGPVEQVTENVRVVEGELPSGRMKRKMSVVRQEDGGLVFHNAMALGEDDMRALEAWGTPRYLVVPNGFHRMDAWVYKQRYPQLKVVAPRGQRKGVARVVDVDLTYDEVPRDDTVRYFHFDGVADNEGVIEVKSASGTVLITNDMLTNQHGLKFPMTLTTGAEGPCVPRIMRWFMMKDRHALRAQVERLAETAHLSRIVIMHGQDITGDVKAALHTVATRLS